MASAAASASQAVTTASNNNAAGGDTSTAIGTAPTVDQLLDDPFNAANLQTDTDGFNLSKGAALAATALAVTNVMNFVPGGRNILTPQNFIDSFDPYGYSTALSRAAVDNQVNSVRTGIVDAFKGKGVEMLNTLVERYPELPVERLKQAVAAGVSPFQIYDLKPGPLSECFPNLLDRKASTSGIPTARCDEKYRALYEQFVTENEERYTEEYAALANDPVGYVNNVNKFLKLALGFKISGEQTEYRNWLEMMAWIIGLTALVIVLVAVVFPKVQK